MVYNSHLKIMKKLLFSLFALVAMSLTFVACEGGEDPGKDKPGTKPGKKPETNCVKYQSYYTDLGDGTALYVLEIVTKDLDEQKTDEGENAIIMFCAEPQEDGAPVAKTYDYVDFASWTETYGEGLLSGVALSQEQFAGTFGYIIEGRQIADIVFCSDGEVKIEGNNTNGTLTAKIEFTSGVQGKEDQVYEREYVFNGEFEFVEKKTSAPAKAAKATRFNK